MVARSVAVPHVCILPNTLRFCLACTLTHQYKPALLIFPGVSEIIVAWSAKNYNV